jgi:hypothetical protein
MMGRQIAYSSYIPGTVLSLNSRSTLDFDSRVDDPLFEAACAITLTSESSVCFRLQLIPGIVSGITNFCLSST